MSTETTDIRKFLLDSRDAASAQATARQDEWQAAYGSENPMSTDQNLAFWMGFYSGRADAYGSALDQATKWEGGL